MASPVLQGRRLKAQTFPSPGHYPPTFTSCSRCLIDLGRVLIVLTEGSGDDAPAHERMLYRLELSGSSRASAAFDSEGSLTKDECETILTGALSALVNCQIVAVRFPFFDEENKNKTKYRPCVALWGAEGPPLYLAIYMGAPRSAQASSLPWEVSLSGPSGDLAPASAPTSIVDVSKVCGMPELYHRPGDGVDGKSTWDLFLLNPKDERTVLTAVQPDKLRAKIIGALRDLLRQNPLTYVDTTRQLDNGSWIESLELIDGEWCVGVEQYCAGDNFSLIH